MSTSPKAVPTKGRRLPAATPTPSERRNGNETVPQLDDPSLYINRELGLIDFQRRVLEEAQDDRNPLLERLMFLSFVGSNIDEFFMVRVAGLKRQIEKGVLDAGPDGMLPVETMRAIRAAVIRLFRNAHDCWNKELVPALEAAGIHIVSYGDLSDEQRALVDSYFQETVFPTLTPLAFDPGRPFPHISNLSLNLAVMLRGVSGEEHFARVKIPDTLPQLVPVSAAPKSRSKSSLKEQTFVWLEQLVTANLSALFPGMTILEAHPFHVTRDADSEIQDLEAGDLLESVEEGVWQRRFADVVRVEVDEAMPAPILEILAKNMGLEREDIYKSSGGPLSMVRVRGLTKIDRPDLKFAPFVPALPPALAKDGEEEDIFSIIRRGDILLQHPFESFQPVIGLLQKAAKDPAVLAIKITLYRVGRNAPIVDALLEAVENGKQVAVLLELKARFDEESNIEWARKLEEYGVHVVYGLIGLKVHCKVALIVRKEGDVIRRYAHLATGNYNAVTAQLYTDVGMLTCDPDIGADCTDLFNFLTGYSAKDSYRKLLVSPRTLRPRMQHLIEREIEHQKAGRGGHLIFKMNALVDRNMIKLLYQASQAGVRVQLLVRGICCLTPGLSGVSENITVTSIVGRFLEHSRIFYFANGGDEEVYLGSADLMPRNLNHRVEVDFPVGDKGLVRLIHEQILGTYLKDQAKARHMTSEGKYVRDTSYQKKNAFNAQEAFLARAAKRQGK